MKKILLFTLILVIAGGLLFAGGSKSGSSSGKTRIEFWGHLEEPINNSFEDLFQRYNARNQEVEVYGTYFPWDDYEAKVQTSLLTGGAGADFYEIWGGWAFDFIEAGTLTEAPTALINEILRDSYEPVTGTLKSSTDGKYYGVPVDFNNEYGGMLVDKKKFQALGIPYPQTWDDIINVARRNTVRRGDIFDVRGLDFTNEDSLSHIFLSMIMSKGGQYWVNGRLNFNTPQAREALQTLVDYVVVDRITNLDSLTHAEGIESYEFLARGEALMVTRGPWCISNLDEEFDMHVGVDFDYVPFPFWGPTKAFPAETGWSMCVPKNSRNGAEAWKFITFMMERENLMQHNIRSAQIPPRRSVAENPAYVRQAPFMKPILDILQYAHFIGPFNTEVFKENLNQVFMSLCQRTGEFADVTAALRALETRTNSELKL